jgi:hypothetical protein
MQHLRFRSLVALAAGAIAALTLVQVASARTDTWTLRGR